MHTLPCSKCGKETEMDLLIATGVGDVYCTKHHPIAYTENKELIVSVREAMNLRGVNSDLGKLTDSPR